MKKVQRFILPYRGAQILLIPKKNDFEIHVQASSKIAKDGNKNIQTSSLDKEKQERKEKSKKASQRKSSVSPRASASKNLLHKIWVEKSTYKNIISKNKAKFEGLVQEYDLHLSENYSNSIKIAISDIVQKSTAKFIYEGIPTVSSKTFLSIKSRDQLMDIMHQQSGKFMKALSGRKFAFSKDIWNKALQSQLKSLVQMHDGSVVSEDEIDEQDHMHFVLIDQRQFNGKFEKEDRLYYYSIVYRFIGAGGYLLNQEVYHYIDNHNKLQSFITDSNLIQKINKRIDNEILISLYAEDELGVMSKKIFLQKSLQKSKGNKELMKVMNTMSKKGKFQIIKDEMEADLIFCNDLEQKKHKVDDDGKLDHQDDEQEKNLKPGEGEYLHITWLLDSCLCNHALIRDQYLMKKRPSKKHKQSKGPNKRVQAEDDDGDDREQ